MGDNDLLRRQYRKLTASLERALNQISSASEVNRIAALKISTLQAEIDEMRAALKFTHDGLDEYNPYYKHTSVFTKYKALANRSK